MEPYLPCSSTDCNTGRYCVVGHTSLWGSGIISYHYKEKDAEWNKRYIRKHDPLAKVRVEHKNRSFRDIHSNRNVHPAIHDYKSV